MAASTNLRTITNTIQKDTSSERLRPKNEKRLTKIEQEEKKKALQKALQKAVELSQEITRSPDTKNPLNNGINSTRIVTELKKVIDTILQIDASKKRTSTSATESDAADKFKNAAIEILGIRLCSTKLNQPEKPIDPAKINRIEIFKKAATVFLNHLNTNTSDKNNPATNKETAHTLNAQQKQLLTSSRP